MAGVEVRAVERHIRMSPQKVRLVLDVVRGKPAQEALAILQFLPQRAARPVAKAVRSAVAFSTRAMPSRSCGYVNASTLAASTSPASGTAWKRRMTPFGR